MDIEELQAALDKYDRVGRGLNSLPASEMVLILEAARQVANPNIEAAKAEGDRQQAIPHVQWLDYHKIVAAALTPGDTE